MAYAALTSLRQTLESSQIEFPDHFGRICTHLLMEMYHLQKFLLENLSAGSEERRIGEAARRLEDVLESHERNQIQLQSEAVDGDDEISYPLTQSQDLALKVILEEIKLFIQTVKGIKKQLRKSSLTEEDEDATILSRIDHHHHDHFAGKKSTIFGLDEDMSNLKYMLLGDMSGLLLVPMYGMAGIGKTTLAKQIYGDPDIVSHFECRVFVSIGPKYRLREILLTILAQILNLGIDNTHVESEEELLSHLHSCLSGRRYLIVLDDVWDEKVWNMLSGCLPDDKMGSRIMLTSRIEGVALHISSDAGKIFHKMRFLNEEESWHLLRAKVFGEENLCPPQLEKAGRKIAENCQGLPLSIIAVAKHLSQFEKTQEYWQKVANEVHLVIGADKEVSKVLSLSYYYLPQHIKACFVYIGIFPHDYDISATKLIKLWCAEGFLESWRAWMSSEDIEHVESENFDMDSKNDFLLRDSTSEDFAMKCLEDLVSRNVVQVRERSSSGGIKACNVYSAFWHICIREAMEDKFFHVINSCANQDIERQRRLCIHKNALFGIKDVLKSMAAIKNAHSLLCTGPHHQYPVPISLGFGFLKVLDALTIRFFGFPNEVVKLVQLRYLAITYNGELPPSISNLQNLQYLIVHRYLNILSLGACGAYLPMEIWSMQELRHLQVMGSNLPCPTSEDALLPNLLTLLDVSVRTCTKKVLKRVPNLKRLGIRIELALDVESSCCYHLFDYLHDVKLELDDIEPSCCCNHREYFFQFESELDVPEPLCRFDHLKYLHKLESLKCYVVSPNLHLVGPTSPYPIFPPGLRKLTLSGTGFPWEYMSAIVELPNLEVLKLRCYAFRGPKWETEEEDFSALKFLLLEDTDLEDWYVDYESFPSLERLSLQHCYKLKEIPFEIGELPNLETIELVDCNPSLVASAKRIEEEQQSSGNDVLQVCVKSSADGRKRKS
ncbi:Disease resistance protein RPP13 [Sesamum alatum]|uniref:Disease resistance protein RPP13 n=1 Tax=Sesamum alatum TaxID=300844 RepID=A0AAE1XY53_9LAMI|nr:Disease resistance protein RPP13 [Sesamum alatum]